MHHAGKRERFEALARPELDALFRTARRMVGNGAVAEEIVQEACLKAFASFDPADEPARFRPWLFRIAVNQALDHLRRARREVPWSTGAAEAADALPDTTLAGQPHASVEGREVGRAVDGALLALAPDVRAVALLVLVEEMSYAEAAGALAISEELVRSRLARARTELRRRLADHAIATTAAPMPTTTPPMPTPQATLSATSKRGAQ